MKPFFSHSMAIDLFGALLAPNKNFSRFKARFWLILSVYNLFLQMQC